MRVLRTISLTLTLTFAAIGVGAAEIDAPFRDCLQCPVMVPLPPGQFVMGAAPGEEARERVPPQRAGHAEPQHTVVIRYRFAIAQYHVTVDEFDAFVQDTAYRSSSPCHTPGDRNPEKDRERDWRNPGFVQNGRHPVTCLIWEDAKAYTAWLANKTGRSYRLPSETEWEYAARAGSTSTRFWGGGIAEACEYANVADRTAFAAGSSQREPVYDFDCSDGHAHTSPVGLFKPNGFGLFDILGNVWQWVEDCWSATYQGIPADGSPMLSGDCNTRIFRGGAWTSHPRSARSAARTGDPHDNRTNDSGLRVALTLPQ
jgi:formylglycine-generating enzyme required for sulfatase activity